MKRWHFAFICVLLQLCIRILKAIPIYDKCYIRKNFTDIVLQEGEVVKYKLQKYVGGSFLKFDFCLMDYSVFPPECKRDDRFFSITESFNHLLNYTFPKRDVKTPFRDSLKLLKINEK